MNRSLTGLDERPGTASNSAILCALADFEFLAQLPGGRRFGPGGEGLPPREFSAFLACGRQSDLTAVHSEISIQHFLDGCSARRAGPSGSGFRAEPADQTAHS